MIGEGNYNLNILEEIKATDSYIELDQAVTGCQTKEIYQSCITRKYIEKLEETCHCLPLSMTLNEKVKQNAVYSQFSQALCLEILTRA